MAWAKANVEGAPFAVIQEGKPRWSTST